MHVMKHNLYDMIQQKQGSSHDCTDNTTSATRHHKGAKPAQGLRKILAILMLMTISISAWATDYVFKYGNNYLGVDANGNLTNYTSFQGPACVWTCDDGLSTTTSRSLYVTISGTKHYLVTNTTNGNSVSTQTTEWANWRINNNCLAYQWVSGNWWNQTNNYAYIYYRENSWRTSNTGRANNNTGYQSNNGNTDYRATITTVQTTPKTATGTLSLALSNVPTSVTWQDGNHIFGVNAQPTVSNVVPAYTIYTFNGGTHYWYSNADHDNVPATIYDANGFNYQWSVTVGGSNLTYVAQNSSMYYGNFDYNPMSQDDMPATVQLRLTHPNYPELTVSATANTTLKGAPSYAVNITPATGGTIRASAATAKQNSQVTLTATPDNGYVFGSWNVRRTDNNASVTVTNNAFTMPASNVTVTATFNVDYGQPYYFYNEEKGVFLSRGGQYGTRCVADNIGIPFNITSKSSSTLVSYDWGTSGLGANLFTDNGTPCTWTFAGNDDDGYTLYNNAAGGYLMATDAHTNITTNSNAANASKWKILTKQQYDIIREAKVAANATAVATRAGLSSIDEIYTYNYRPVDKTTSVRNASLINSNQGWTSTASPNRYFNVTTNANGTEVYQGSGVLSQTVTGLQEGVYKVRMLGYFRDGGDADDWSYAQAGYPISVMYLAANGQEARFPNRSEQGEAQDNPNSMAQFRTLANQGRYVAELYTYVGSDGRLDLSVNVPSYKATCWAIFSDLTLTYYENQMTGYTLVHNGSDITNMNGKYLLAEDFVPGDNPIGTDRNRFRGTVDGQYNVIDGLTHPLFGIVENATLKNIIVDNVNIIEAGDAGAIAVQANGNSRIYNCGVLSTGSTFEFDKPVSGNTSKVTSTGSGMSAGGIVGSIFGNTRVANCFSYADVSATGGGGAHASGIVGYAGSWITAADQAGATNCFVMNCMCYGDITAGDNRSPIVYVVDWTNNNNARQTWSTYSYFRYKSIRTIAGLGQYNAMAAQEDMWLKRFKFYQSAVTNHRDLAAKYIFNDAGRINEIAQWYIDESIAPWPILRKAGPQKSILERVIPNTGKANEGNLITNGKKLVDEDGNILDDDVTKRYNMNVGSGGYLTVNFSINGSSYSKRLPITDMDHEHYDYTWGKVVLPFANEFEGWTRNYDYICTGWEISSVTGGTTGTLTDYNFADRNCTAKDIYHATNNPIIFAQGGNWIVPYGVTSINVKAHFAKAYYLADANYDCSGGGGNPIGGTRPTTYHGRTVYNTVQGAWGAMESKTLPHDQALVLVGNFHYNSNQSESYTGKGCTIMSVDEDNDQQPDFGWYMSVAGGRKKWMSVKWDFIPIYGFSMVQAGTAPPGLNIPKATGWFEMTETVLCRTYEFEINDNQARTNTDNGKGNNAYILNGGFFQQLVRNFNQDNGTYDRLSYLKVGGNAYIKEFFHGNHSKPELKHTIRPINVTGGEIEQCFMTGMGLKNEIVDNNTNQPNNVRFYCAGGKIDKYLSAYNGYPVVDATMEVDHARIGRFFGGGTSPSAAISGDIKITMNYSNVDFFCGGPEFGDMGDGKTVIVNTTGSIFGEYYGAGFGGTALTRITNGDNKKDPFSVTGRARLNYNAGEGGFEVSYEMEALLNENGAALFRYYDYRADLSMASTGNVTTTATGCLFLNDFFGGGCQGTVNGNTESTLTNCDVRGSAYGGGYKAAATVVNVLPAGGNTWQEWDATYKAYSNPIYPAAQEYTWVHTDNTPAANPTNRTLGTKVDLTNLGTVTSNTSITINGGVVHHHVFGGGFGSKVNNNTNVMVKGPAFIHENVYGGGNAAEVNGNTNVVIGE